MMAQYNYNIFLQLNKADLITKPLNYRKLEEFRSNLYYA